MTERKSGTIEVYENKAGDGVIPTTLDGRNIREISVNGWDIDDDVFQRLRYDIDIAVSDAQCEQDRLAREKYIQESPNRNAILATEDLHSALYWMSIAIQKEEDDDEDTYGEHQVYDFATSLHMIRRALGHLSEITGEESKYSYFSENFKAANDPYGDAMKEMSDLDDILYYASEKYPDTEYKVFTYKKAVDKAADVSFNWEVARSGKFVFTMSAEDPEAAEYIGMRMRELYEEFREKHDNTTGGDDNGS